jgi:hypothetical protein
MVAPKPTEEAESEKPKAESVEAQAESIAEPITPKPGFKPRFNMKMAAPKPAEESRKSKALKPREPKAPKARF